MVFLPFAVLGLVLSFCSTNAALMGRRAINIDKPPAAGPLVVETNSGVLIFFEAIDGNPDNGYEAIGYSSAGIIPLAAEHLGACLMPNQKMGTISLRDTIAGLELVGILSTKIVCSGAYNACRIACLAGESLCTGLIKITFSGLKAVANLCSCARHHHHDKIDYDSE
jgi:hypothetical protein